ncbi:hypothetical protein SAY86_020497 [Trapa natans]|uniref:Uncharacterized protein n=1 Tax=Trapa natans TaxID=22666 RepID=A0AAN7LJ42_TRANT|nr:hypothetical protein SAY86_020497 [Trapa natans]
MAAAASLDSPQASHINEVPAVTSSPCSSPPLFNSPSDKRFWSALRSRVDMLLETRDKIPTDPLPPAQAVGIRSVASSDDVMLGWIKVLLAFDLFFESRVGVFLQNTRGLKRMKGLKEDTVLLMRGFDSVAHTLSQLSANINDALQGARDLGKPPTLTDILKSNLRSKEDDQVVKENVEKEEGTKCLKRKFDSSDDPDDQQAHSVEKVAQDPAMTRMKRAKNLAVSMATKASSLAKELRLIKSDLSFVQERCTLLEEENTRLRDGFSTGTPPEDDDLVRLQLETLLAEKSRLANENANLVRENQCLSQLVTYHRLNMQDISASYEEFISGMRLDFSFSSSPLVEDQFIEDDNDGSLLLSAPKDMTSISASLEFEEKQRQEEEPQHSQAD